MTLAQRLLIDDALEFARRTHNANPQQETAAIFNFYSQTWQELIAEWLTQAELKHTAEICNDC